MFKRLLTLWRSPRRIDELQRQAIQLIELTRDIDRALQDSLTGQLSLPEAVDEVEAHLRAGRQLRRELRRGVEKHLILCPGMNVSASLELWKLADESSQIERCCRHLLGTFEQCGQPPSALQHRYEIAALNHHVTRTLGSSLRAFERDDEHLARSLLADETLAGRRCDALVHTVTRADIGPREAACAVQWIRWLHQVDTFSRTLSRTVLPPTLSDEEPLPQGATDPGLTPAATPQDA